MLRSRTIYSLDWRAGFLFGIIAHAVWLELIYFNIQGQFRGRTEIAPDVREKFLQKFQQMQQGHSTLLGMPPLAGGNPKQFSSQQQNPLLHQVVFFI